jgi:DNA-directed RNA polymerase specialized sigma24 family protein
MDVAEVGRRCQEETHRFYRREQHSTTQCMELFRRALTLKSQAAWDLICKIYYNQVKGWIQRSSAFDTLDHPIDELVTLSFERFWHACPRRVAFDSFRSLESILAYLRACCMSVVIDLLRYRQREQHLVDIANVRGLATAQQVENEIADKEQRRSLWEDVKSQLTDERELFVMEGYFHYGLKPSHIFAQYPEYFEGVEEIYRVRRNVIRRLRQSDEFREVWQESDLAG